MQVRFDVMDAMEQSIALSNPFLEPANKFRELTIDAG
jgi:hypothetical protein